MRRRRVLSLNHALDLAQLLHEVELGVQPAGRVDDRDGGIAALGGADGVEGDRAWVGAFAMGDADGACAISPGFDLLDRSSPEGVTSSNDHLVALRVVEVRELPDRRRLAGAVDPHDEDDARSGQVFTRVVAPQLALE